MQLIPFGIGSCIESAYFGSADDRRISRLEKFIEEVAEEMKKVKDQVRAPNEEYFKSDNFAFFFENVIRRVDTEASNEKLRALRGVLVTILLDQGLADFDKRSSFLKTIDLVEALHLQVLQFLAARSDRSDEERFVSHATICRRFGASSEADTNFVYSTLDTLANREFIISGPVPFDVKNRIDKQRQEFRATALGVEFLRFVRLEGAT